MVSVQRDLDVIVLGNLASHGSKSQSAGNTVLNGWTAPVVSTTGGYLQDAVRASRLKAGKCSIQSLGA